MTVKEPAKLSIRFQEALIYATQLHANQTRKISNVPYISHLLSVAALVLDLLGNKVGLRTRFSISSPNHAASR